MCSVCIYVKRLPGSLFRLWPSKEMADEFETGFEVNKIVLKQ